MAVNLHQHQIQVWGVTQESPWPTSSGDVAAMGWDHTLNGSTWLKIGSADVSCRGTKPRQGGQIQFCGVKIEKKNGKHGFAVCRQQKF